MGINRGAGRLRDLIEDLLALTRLSRVQNPYEEASIQQAVEAVLERLEIPIRETGTRVVLDTALPAVWCDRIKITEVFYNLINNAIKFSSGGPSRPEIHIGCRIKEGQGHEFYVRDNGIGIDPAHHQEIFGIFKRLHAADQYTGTGAGLTIVKNIVEDHGGTVSVESEEGRRATFYFTIPDRPSDSR